MKLNYWSCSKFADWLRGSAKPSVATSKGWVEWKKAAKDTHPIRYWIVEEGLDYVQNFVNWPANKLTDIRYYINNRWVTKSHACTAHPKDIKPGEWCDVGERFLPCLFNELVDFVEVEAAWHHARWSEESLKKYNVPQWRKSWMRWRTWRCPEAGMAHLVWESGLKNEELCSPSDLAYGKPTNQAIAAKEIIDLYIWWKHIRPQRPDPMDASGWTEICERRRLTHGIDMIWPEDSAQDKIDTTQALNKCQELEQQYEQEDEQMMIRLIGIRHSLWT